MMLPSTMRVENILNHCKEKDLLNCESDVNCRHKKRFFSKTLSFALTSNTENIWIFSANYVQVLSSFWAVNEGIPQETVRRIMI
jgi:hypothetical protein